MSKNWVSYLVALCFTIAQEYYLEVQLLYMNSMMSYLVNIGCLKKSNSYATPMPLLANRYESLVSQRAENRLLNAQAPLEYESLKSRVLIAVADLNKVLENDDQIIVQQYQSCMSVRYHQQFFVMEFKQIPTDQSFCNHALDLIFQGSDGHADSSGRTTLTLVKERYQFIWRQSNPISGGPAGSSKVISSLVLRWLKNEEGLYMRFAPA